MIKLIEFFSDGLTVFLCIRIQNTGFGDGEMNVIRGDVLNLPAAQRCGFNIEILQNADG